MNDPILVLDQIEQILADARAWDRPGQLSAYAAVMILLRDLREYLVTLDSVDVGYATGKVVEAEWHVGAMFGLDIDNGLPTEQHHVGAIGALRVLENLLKQGG
jgi:hypothetical protein